MFTPTPAPRGATVDELAFYVQEQLEILSALLQGMNVTAIQLAVLNVAPTRPREGLVVFADGTNWNPGSGKGVYVYASSAWVKL